jgi:hypothetical protein
MLSCFGGETVEAVQQSRRRIFRGDRRNEPAGGAGQLRRIVTAAVAMTWHPRTMSSSLVSSRQ